MTGTGYAKGNGQWYTMAIVCVIGHVVLANMKCDLQYPKVPPPSESQVISCTGCTSNRRGLVGSPYWRGGGITLSANPPSESTNTYNS